MPMTTTTAERAYAELALLLLRENGVTDAEILTDYTQPCARADAALERQYHAETGDRVCAARIKRWMKRRLMH